MNKYFQYAENVILLFFANLKSFILDKIEKQSYHSTKTDLVI